MEFSIPYKLKHYIDIVTQPGLSWSYTPEEGIVALMGGKEATVVYASGDMVKALALNRMI